MERQLLEATERAITKVIRHFQDNPERFWNERDIHWSLFYYLKREAVVQEAYMTQLIRAEFPTLKKFGGRKLARGHYDLVILDSHSYNSPAVQQMKAQAPWDDLLKLVRVAVAVEIKLWLAKLSLERADWDIRKLMEPPNKVMNAYFINFVQLNFNKPPMQDYYLRLTEHLREQKNLWPKLKILCVPSDVKMQPEPRKNWF